MHRAAGADGDEVALATEDLPLELDGETDQR